MSKKNISSLKLFASMVKPEFKRWANSVVEAYEARRIPSVLTAEKLIDKLANKSKDKKKS
jgi:hypothetical protein